MLKEIERHRIERMISKRQRTPNNMPSPLRAAFMLFWLAATLLGSLNNIPRTAARRFSTFSRVANRQFTGSQLSIPAKRWHNVLAILSRTRTSLAGLACRGGAGASAYCVDSGDEDDEEGGYDNEYDDEENEGEQNNTEKDIQSDSTPSSSVMSAVVKSLASVSKAIIRALSAALQGVSSEEGSGKELSIVERLIQTMQYMWSAAVNPDGVDQSDTQKTKSKSTTSESGASSDFGSYLAQAYGIADERSAFKEGKKPPSPILGGSLQSALKIARSNARFLVVFIPSAPPKANDKNDIKAATSLLSAKVSAAAEKKARKKGTTASFVLWGAKAGSSEATLAMKQLKVKATKSKGGKRPVLLVAYPAMGTNSKGEVKIVPKVIAKQHCNPPLSSEAMAQWMNALRKRHAKQYAIMQRDLKEAEYFKERKEGYKESIQSDVERKLREKKEEEERLAKEKVEKERVEALERRRQELLESLPAEPGSDVKDAITMSIRFLDGRSGKRRFTQDTQLSAVFNWVDALFQMEREIVILTTMNGKQTFSLEDTTDNKTLKDAGIGRMAGFRVTEKKAEEEKKEEEELAEGEKES